MSTRNEPWLDKEFAQKLHRLSLFSRKALVSSAVGDHRSSRKGVSMEFVDYRKYVPGDDLRRIDWNIYARLGPVFVKLTEAQEALTVHLLLDCSLSMGWGSPSKLRYAKRAAAALGFVALHHSDWVSAACLGRGVQSRFPAARGRGQIAALFDFLDRAEPAGETNLAQALRSYNQRQHGHGLRGLVVLISDLLNPTGLAEGLPYVAEGQTEVVVVHLLDPEEANPSLQGDLRLEDVETGQPVEITITPAVLDRYRERYEAWCQEMEGICRGRNVQYVRLLTDWPLENLILSYLRQRRILR